KFACVFVCVCVCLCVCVSERERERAVCVSERMREREGGRQREKRERQKWRETGGWSNPRPLSINPLPSLVGLSADQPALAPGPRQPALGKHVVGLTDKDLLRKPVHHGLFYS